LIRLITHMDTPH